MVSKSPSEKEALRSKRENYNCQRCLNHGIKQPRKNHKCPFRSDHACRYGCQLVDARRVCNQKITKNQDTNQPIDVEKLDAPGDEGTTTAGPKLRAPKCAKCKLHGLTSQLKGHKKTCPFENCSCELCDLVSNRREVMAKQVRLRRSQQGKEEVVTYPQKMDVHTEAYFPMRHNLSCLQPPQLSPLQPPLPPEFLLPQKLDYTPETPPLTPGNSEPPKEEGLPKVIKPTPLRGPFQSCQTAPIGTILPLTAPSKTFETPPHSPNDSPICLHLPTEAGLPNFRGCTCRGLLVGEGGSVQSQPLPVGGLLPAPPCLSPLKAQPPPPHHSSCCAPHPQLWSLPLHCLSNHTTPSLVFNHHFGQHVPLLEAMNYLTLPPHIH